MAEENISQPEKEYEILLNDIAESGKDTIELRGKKWRIGWLRNGTKRKITQIFLKEKREDKVGSKCVAALILNGYWKIKFFYWFLWRWFYYVKQYSDVEMIPVVHMCKKKIQVTGYFVLTILLTGIRDTIMMMTLEEAERSHQGASSDRHGTSEKSTLP